MIVYHLASTAIIFDWLTKWLAWQYWPERIVVNKGLPFGIPASPIFALLFTTAVLAVLFWYYSHLEQKTRFKYSNQVGFGFIFGGALGNFLERLITGRVTDFIIYRTGVFNFADLFIFIGLFILAISLFNPKSLNSK